VSLLESVLASLDGFPLWSSISNVTPTRSGNFHPAALPAYSVFPASDGYIAIGAAGPSFTRFMALLDRPDLDRGLMPAGADERRAWFDEVVDAITRWCSTRTRGDVHEALEAVGIPNEPVRDLSEVWSDPQLEARDFYLEYDYDAFGTIRTMGSPIHLSSSPLKVRHVPPAAGEHNDEILRETLGYDDARIRALFECGALWGAADG